MKILVIYESFFGNTEKIARAVAEAAAAYGEVELLPVAQVTAAGLQGAQVVFLGSPTRGFRATEGVAKFLEALPEEALDGVRAVAFDTRILLDTIHSPLFRFVVNKGGYAAASIDKALKKKGAQMLAAPEGFRVTGEQGPLQEGELERAAGWAANILSAIR